MTPLEQEKHFPKPKHLEEGVINPTADDFSIHYDSNEDKNPVLFTAKAYAITYFPSGVALHVKEHLAKQLLFQEHSIPVDWVQAVKDKMKELTP